jgi:hypothetical protein
LLGGGSPSTFVNLYPEYSDRINHFGKLLQAEYDSLGVPEWDKTNEWRGEGTLEDYRTKL